MNMLSGLIHREINGIESYLFSNDLEARANLFRN